MTKAQKLERIREKARQKKVLTPAEEKLVEAAKTDGRFVRTLKEAAAQIGVARQSMDEWKPKDTEGALVKGPHGYDMEAVKRLRARFFAEGQSPVLLPGDVGVTEEDPGILKARKLRLECDKLATQIDILRGKYALVEDVMAGLMPIIYAIKERFLKLGPEVSFQLSGMEPADIEDKIRTEVEKILNKLADEDIPRLGEILGQPKDIGEEDGRLPAARQANGRQKAA